MIKELRGKNKRYEGWFYKKKLIGSNVESLDISIIDKRKKKN